MASRKELGKDKKRSKLVTFVVLQLVFLIFGLTASITGAYAWFTMSTTANVEADLFTVVNEFINIDSIKLCKFDYNEIAGLVDYFRPEDGSVNVYDYVSGEGHNRFEDEDGNPQVMNLFDPVRIELGDDLRDLYCNSIYIVTISSNRTSYDLNVLANLVTKEKRKNTDLFLSDCLDFDIYTDADLAAVTGKTYYPRFIDEGDRESIDLTGYDEIFYKIAYLSSLEADHANFYSENPKPSQIEINDSTPARSINFVNGTATFYINVNYAISELEQYSVDLIKSNRDAIFDYYFSLGE